VESGRTWLSAEEVRGAGVMERVAKGELTQKAAAAKLGICYRQLKRLYGRYRKQGAGGLKHGNAGRRSNRARPEKLQQKVLALVRKHSSGGEGERFGPTLAAEHLSEEHGIELDAETLRRWMLKAGLWSRVRKSKRYRSRRQRKAHFGELLQLDGSFHRWLEDRAEQGCLINLVDDATGMAVAQFAEEETTWAVADVLRKWVERNGIPRAIYTDWKSCITPSRSKKAASGRGASSDKCAPGSASN
jgi:transposase